MLKSGTPSATKTIRLERTDMYKYPRTMDQAFPGGPDYACSMRAPRRNILSAIGLGVLWAGILACMLMLMLAYFDVLVK